MTRKALIGLIAVTTAVYFTVYLAAQAVPVAGGALIVGLLWLILEIKNTGILSTVFFVFFLGLALWGSLDNLPLPALLLGVSTALAAWDLSRFRARILDEADDAINPLLEAKHLQALSVTVGAGFLIALLALVISLSINFVAVGLVMLVIMLVLRRSIHYLRSD